MPQMAPLSWLTLFLIFSITLIVFCTLNYFSFFYSIKKNENSKKINSSPMNWKW